MRRTRTTARPSRRTRRGLASRGGRSADDGAWLLAAAFVIASLFVIL